MWLIRLCSELKRAPMLRTILETQQKKSAELFKTAGIKPHL
jgi:hypothetical protein